MKKVFTSVLLVAASLSSFSQTVYQNSDRPIPQDTIFTQSRTFIGQMEYFKNGVLYEDTLISIDSIKEASIIVPLYTKETASKEKEFIGYKIEKNYKISSENFNDNTFKHQISKSGAFGISSATCLFIGNIMNIVSIFKPSKPLSVTGLSLTSIGITMLIPTFTTLRTSSNKKIYIY